MSNNLLNRIIFNSYDPLSIIKKLDACLFKLIYINLPESYDYGNTEKFQDLSVEMYRILKHSGFIIFNEQFVSRNFFEPIMDNVFKFKGQPKYEERGHRLDVNNPLKGYWPIEKVKFIYPQGNYLIYYRISEVGYLKEALILIKETISINNISFEESSMKVLCNKTDIFLDIFCGVGINLAKAEKLNLQWIGIGRDFKNRNHKKFRKLFINDSVKTYLRNSIQNNDFRHTKEVYVISHPNYDLYKVGTSLDSISRLSQYQIADPDRRYKLEYKKESKDFKIIEKAIHWKYENKSEWIRGNLNSIIRDIRYPTTLLKQYKDFLKKKLYREN